MTIILQPLLILKYSYKMKQPITDDLLIKYIRKTLSDQEARRVDAKLLMDTDLRERYQLMLDMEEANKLQSFQQEIDAKLQCECFDQLSDCGATIRSQKIHCNFVVMLATFLLSKRNLYSVAAAA